MFLDIVGYSRLQESEQQAVATKLWAWTKEAIGRTPPIRRKEVVLQNTWGDAVFLSTTSVPWAAALALEVRRMFDPAALRRLCLPRELTCRISLHAGKATEVRNPLRDVTDVVGDEVNRCARAEPVTKPGRIYMTHQLRSRLRAADVRDVLGGASIVEIGVIALAKGFGASMIYSLGSSVRFARTALLSAQPPTVSDGVATPAQVDASEYRLPGENFAVELLQTPARLRRTARGGFSVRLWRTDVSQVLISNDGKKYAVDKYVTAANHGRLLRWDRDVQRFLAGGQVDGDRILRSKAGESMVVDPEILKTRLRWASGGAMSVVTRREDGTQWVPFFFRDIHPFGWNIALGQSERQFDRHGRREGDHSVHHEHQAPGLFMQREFLEETVVLEPSVRRRGTDDVHYRMVRFQVGQDARVDRYVRRYHSQMRRLRLEQDSLRISPHGRVVRLQNTVRNSSLTVDGVYPTTDVLVCFSLLDLGIEVVGVHEYTIGGDALFLDGEMTTGDGGVRDLVRMPVALLSLGYLRGAFGTGDWEPRYTEGQSPSIIAARAPGADDVWFMPDDVGRRMKAVRVSSSGRPGVTGFQRKRYTAWYDAFGTSFLDKSGKPCKDHLPRLFVPGTAKILNLYFARGYSDRAQPSVGGA